MIDDSDPRLTYYGDWFTSSQNSAIAYNRYESLLLSVQLQSKFGFNLSTWRGTNKSTSSVSFTFYG